MLFYLAYYKKLYSGTKTYGGFFKNRFVREYPLMIFATVSMYLISIIYYRVTFQTPPRSITAFNLIMSLLFGSLTSFKLGVALNGLFWYIFVLNICYLLSCLFTYIHSKTKTNPYLFILPIIMGIAMYFLYRQESVLCFYDSGIPRGFICYFLGFYLGICLEKFSSCTKTTKLIIRIISLILLVLLLALFFTEAKVYNSNKFDLSLSFGLTIFPLIIFCCYDLKLLNTFCSNRFVKSLGAVSFPIYGLSEVVRVIISISDPTLTWCKSIGAYYWLLLIALSLLSGYAWYYLEIYCKKTFMLIRARLNNK